ncbi:MAG: SPOR domain-containing protein [Rickettsiales bacterium]|nr:SPOR domain-containing protein [Rickettsiales bacterium]
MKSIISVFVVLSLISCVGNKSKERRVPVHNEAYLNNQNGYQGSYQFQNAYQADTKRDKGFFNQLFKSNETEKVDVVDEVNTGNLQMMSKNYKSKAIDFTTTNEIANEDLSDVSKSKVNVVEQPKNTIVASNSTNNVLTNADKGYKLLDDSVPGTYVQIAAFKKYNEALNIVPDLLKFNNVVINQRTTDSGAIWYRVRVGPVVNKTTAKTLQADLSKAGYRDSLIIIGE